METATAIANYEATDDSEISLVEGDFIEIYQKEGKGNFWFGKNLRGKLEGYFPASCVKTSRGKVGSVAATIGNSVLADDGQTKPSSPTKPALLPKPMISPKTMGVCISFYYCCRMMTNYCAIDRQVITL